MCIACVVMQDICWWFKPLIFYVHFLLVMVDGMPFNVKYATFVVQKDCNSRNSRGNGRKIFKILQVIEEHSVGVYWISVFWKIYTLDL